MVQHARDRTLIGDLAFDTLRHQLQRVAHFRLEVAIGRATRHGANGTHAAIRLERTALIKIDLTRAFIRSGEKRANHGSRCAGGDRLGKVAGELDAAVGDDGDVLVLRGLDCRHDGGELRHADAGDDAVVQMEPGPIPTLTASAPASISARVPS